MTSEQSPTITFLADPATHGTAVERATTHISELFLAGDRAYKLKRAVALPYLDFSSTERRRLACEAEVAINRRTAPKIYLGVVPIVRGPDGTLALGKVGQTSGRAVDWVVVMRRFDQSQLFDRLADRGALTGELIGELVDQVVALHRAAAPHRKVDSAGELQAVLDESLAEFGDQSELLPELAERARGALGSAVDLLGRRAAAGKVRRCHGDLHLRNVCTIDGRPTLFDAVEFNDAFAVIDVLYDLAFLVMDLLHRSLRPLANQAINRYLEAVDEFDGVPALGFLLALRAIVRAKIEATLATQTEMTTRAEHQRETAAYLALAQACLAPGVPRLLAIGGLSGTGKTTVARGLAPELGRVPGALIVRSDVVRKQLAGIRLETHLDAWAYGSHQAARVYDEMRRRAELALRSGYAVVLDAVHARPEERTAAAALAHRLGVPFAGLWLSAAPDRLLERVAARTGDASDATVDVVRQQLGYETGEIEWPVIETVGSPDAVLAKARAAIG